MWRDDEEDKCPKKRKKSRRVIYEKVLEDAKRCIEGSGEEWFCFSLGVCRSRHNLKNKK